MSRLPSAYDGRWYAAALKQIADARWKNQRLTVITGPPGAGKTTLCRQVADRKGTRTLGVLLSSPPAAAQDFLRALALEIGVLSEPASASAAIDAEELRQAVRDFFASLATLGADCLVIVDDAHRLDAAAREEVDALVALPAGRRGSLQFVLVGQFGGAIEPPAPLSAAERERTLRPPRPVPLTPAAYVPLAIPAARQAPAPTVAAEALEPAPASVADVAAALSPAAADTDDGAMVAEPPTDNKQPSLGSVFQFNRRRLASFGITAASAVSAVVWYSVLTRSAVVPPPSPAPPPNAASRARAEAALMAIVAELDDDAEAQRSIGSSGTIVQTRAGWPDDVARRAAVLAKLPDLPGLLALRSAVAALHAQSGEEARLVQTVLRRLDDTLADARKRQLEIDHRQLIDAPSSGPR